MLFFALNSTFPINSIKETAESMLNEYRKNLKQITPNAKLFLFGGIFNGLGMAVFGLLFNLYLEEYGFSKTDIGRILSLGSLGATVVAIPAALIIERTHVKKILFWSTILATFAFLGQIYFKTLPLLFLFGFLGNVFISVYRIAVAPFFMRNSNKSERIYLFSINAALGMLSSLLGAVIGGWLPDFFRKFHLAPNLGVAYEMALYVGIVASAIAIVPFFFITQKPIPVDRTDFLAKIKNYDWKIIGKLMVPKMLIGMGAGLVIPFMNLYFKNVFNLETSQIGYYFSILQVFMFVGMMAAPVISRRFSMLNFIVWTELISVPFMLILALTNNLGLAVGAFILRGMLMNMSTPIASNLEMEIVKEEDQPLTNAISTLAWNGAWTISANFGGAIIEKYSFQYSFYVTIVLYISSAASYYFLLKGYKLATSRGN